jgi:hypothetical protein
MQSLDRATGEPETERRGRRALISAAISAVGLLLLATSVFAPGFRPGDAVGADISAGFVFGLGSLLIFVGVAAGVVAAWGKPRRLRALVVLVVIPVAAAGLIVWLAAQQYQKALYESGFTVRIVNDRPQHVGVAQCNGFAPVACDSTESIHDLAPGDFAVAFDGSQTANPWRVTTAEGYLIGCLLLPLDANPGRTLIVNVSSAVASHC